MGPIVRGRTELPPPAPCDESKGPEPRSSIFTRFVDKIAKRISKEKFCANPLGPNRLTHERPFFESKVFGFGLEWGLTVSEFHQLRVKEGTELIHVVNTDGSSNLELVLGRKEIGKGQRVELQGPALNTSLSPGSLPVGARFVGVGLTSDLIDKEAKEAVSYTLEVKATERTAIELAMLAAPGAAAAAAKLLGDSPVGTLVAEAFSAAIPVVAGLIAISTARWAYKVCKDPEAKKSQKALAVAHAVSDAVRIVCPLAGVLGNAALVLVSAGASYLAVRRMKKSVAPPTGPPPLE